MSVRLANLMKVLTSDAVQDPTKVEAKVRKEVAQRAQKHEDDNQSRKLTAEEKKEKEYQRMLAKERRGIYGAVFKWVPLSLFLFSRFDDPRYIMCTRED